MALQCGPRVRSRGYVVPRNRPASCSERLQCWPRVRRAVGMRRGKRQDSSPLNGTPSMRHGFRQGRGIRTACRRRAENATDAALQCAQTGFSKAVGFLSQFLRHPKVGLANWLQCGHGFESRGVRGFNYNAIGPHSFSVVDGLQCGHGFEGPWCYFTSVLLGGRMAGRTLQCGHGSKPSGIAGAPTKHERCNRGPSNAGPRVPKSPWGYALRRGGCWISNQRAVRPSMRPTGSKAVVRIER